jgi:hypothetical protein
LLPTYPKIVQRRTRLNQLVMKRLVNSKSPVLGEIAQHTMHEGRSSDIHRQDGSVGKTKIKTHSATAEMAKTPLCEFDLDALYRLLENMAEQFAKTMTEDVFEVVSEGAEAVGNVVDGKGRPLSPELLLEILERIQLDFHADGTPHELIMPLTPQQHEKMMAALGPRELDELNRKAAAIFERKRADYRHREAGRILAG